MDQLLSLLQQQPSLAGGLQSMLATMLAASNAANAANATVAATAHFLHVVRFNKIPQTHSKDQPTIHGGRNTNRKIAARPAAQAGEK